MNLFQNWILQNQPSVNSNLVNIFCQFDCHLVYHPPIVKAKLFDLGDCCRKDSFLIKRFWKKRLFDLGDCKIKDFFIYEIV